MMVRLSKRMEAAARLVPKQMKLVDVGCDHGYLPIYLVQNGKISSAIAADINPGPIERARHNIRQFGLEQKIDTRCCDGLKGILPEEAEVISICGMGGNLMQKILTEAPQTVTHAKALVLQPQSELFKFREFLSRNCFLVEAEDMVFEEGKFYNMFRVVHGTASYHTRVDHRLGKLLFEARHPVLLQYMKKKKREDEAILTRIAASGNAGHEERIQTIKEELEDIAWAMRYYEMS